MYSVEMMPEVREHSAEQQVPGHGSARPHEEPQEASPPIHLLRSGVEVLLSARSLSPRIELPNYGWGKSKLWMDR